MGGRDLKSYWESRLTEDYGPGGVGLLGAGTRYNAWMYRVRRRVFNRVLKGLGCDFSTYNVLDMGTGTGFYIDRWKELGVMKVTGSDITSVAVRNLKSRYPGDEFFELDIGEEMPDGPLAGGSGFDAVSAMDMLYHVVDNGRYEKAIRNVYSLLRPGGLFVLTENFFRKGDAEAGGIPDDAHHVSRSYEHIERVLTEAGFSVLTKAPVFFLMNKPVDTDSFMLKKLWHLTARFITGGEALGHLAGAVLYPFEILIVRHVRKGPSTEIMICRKPE